MAPAADVGHYVVVGLGGIGGLLLRLLVPFLHSRGVPCTVLAVDGDRFEERDHARMHFDHAGMKATVLTAELAATYGDRVTFVPVPHFLTPRNARRLIGERDVVFCQPDNHATRRLAERTCRRLRDVALFTAGNDGIEHGRTGTRGSVHVYLRAEGRELTNPPSRNHPEIARPADRLPAARGCAALAAAGAPQLLFTNAAVAATTLGAFYAWREGVLDCEEVYLDVLTARSVPVRRVVARR